MKIILLLVLCLTTMSCNTTSDPIKEFNGNVKVLKVFDYDASEKFGEPTVGELLSSYVREYDSDGKKTTIEDDDGYVFKYEYNKKGQEVKSSYYNNEGELRLVYNYEYNDKGEKIKESLFGNDGKLIFEIGRASCRERV